MSTLFLNKIKKIDSIKTIAVIRSKSTAFGPDRQRGSRPSFQAVRQNPERFCDIFVPVKQRQHLIFHFHVIQADQTQRSEEHTSELQSP